MELHHMDLELELAKLLGPPLYPHLDLLPTPVLGLETPLRMVGPL